MGPATFPGEAGLRLDRLLAQKLAISAAAARRLIAGGQVRVDGRRARKGTILRGGEVIAVVGASAGADGAGDPALGPARPAQVERDVETDVKARSFFVIADPTVRLDVLYEDAHLVAVAKPGGMPTHPLRPGERGTVANGIVARFPECAAASVDSREGGLAHRLDTATSGVLIAARSREVWLALRRVLGSEGCEKTYLAEVRGAPPTDGRIAAPIGRRGRRGAAVRVGGGGRRPQDAVTSWTVVERRPNGTAGVPGMVGSAGPDAAETVTSLLEVRLHAGRPHQVRAHLAAAGHPLVGDPLYGGAPEDAALHLHAWRVRLAHPVTGRELIVEAPRPGWASGIVADLL